MPEDVLTPREAIQEDKSFKRSLSLLDATMVVAGSMIGSGIFIVSADITRNVGSAGWLLFVWLITGFMTLVAAVSYGELSGMFPKAGGQYVYLKEAYNPFISFLYGWSLFAVIQTGTIAAVGVAFSKFTAYLIPALSEDNILLNAGWLKISAAQIVSIVLIVLLTWNNTRGIKEGKIIQTLFTSAKLLSLFGLIIFGLFALKPDVWGANWNNAWEIGQGKVIGSDAASGWTVLPYAGVGAIMGAIAASMVGSVFSSDAWNNVTFIAGEIKNPKRNVPIAIMAGVGIAMTLYVLLNYAFMQVLPVSELAAIDENNIAAAVVAGTLMGKAGTVVIAVLIMICTFGAVSGCIIVYPRIYYRMAQENFFFKKAANVHPAFRTPYVSLIFSMIWSSILVISGTFDLLTNLVIFAGFFFYALLAIGLIRMKRKGLITSKVTGYPVIPFIVILFSLALIVNTVIVQPQQSLAGLFLVLIGVPFYYYFKRKYSNIK